MKEMGILHLIKISLSSTLASFNLLHTLSSTHTLLHSHSCTHAAVAGRSGAKQAEGPM